MVKRLTYLLALTICSVTPTAFADSWGVEARETSLETGEPTINLFRHRTMSLAECKEWVESDPFGFGVGEVAMDGKRMYVVNFEQKPVSMSCFANRVMLSGEQRLILPLGLDIED
jgi:hypothetical protein